MSMMSTLAKVAIGVAVAKGASSMMKRSGQQPSGQTQEDGLFRASHSPDARPDNHGLENMMDQILGGAQPASQQSASQPQTGGLGGLLEELAGGGKGVDTAVGGMSKGSPSGGLDDLLAGMGKGSPGGGGGLGDLLGGLLGGATSAATKTGTNHAGKQSDKRAKAKTSNDFGDDEQGGFGDVLSSQFDSNSKKARQPSPDQEVAAALMIRAMVQATKADGKFDLGERKKLTDKLGDISPDEQAFVQAEMERDVDVDWLVAQVPNGLQAQIYTMSVLGIELDENSEAQYLHQLAKGLDLEPNQVNHIHARLGVPAIYR